MERSPYQRVYNPRINSDRPTQTCTMLSSMSFNVETTIVDPSQGNTGSDAGWVRAETHINNTELESLEANSRRGQTGNILFGVTPHEYVLSTGKKFDVILEVDGFDIKAHKKVLAARSPYFEAMFKNLEDRHQHRIKVQDISLSTLELLVNYIYTDKIQFTEENVRVLLPAATLLQLSYVSTRCCTLLYNQLRPSNCLGTRSLVDACDNISLLERIDEYIAKHFMEVIKEDEYLKLSQEQVAQLIRSEGIYVLSELIVFDSVIAWVKADVQNRHSAFVELMKHVRLSLIDPCTLVQRVREEPLIDENPEVKAILLKCIGYQMIISLIQRMPSLAE